MGDSGPEQLKNLLLEGLKPLANKDFADELRAAGAAMAVCLGVRTEDIESVMKTVDHTCAPEAKVWVHFVDEVLATGHRELILAGLFAVEQQIPELDDLFGEKLGGWARTLTNVEIADVMAHLAGRWVLEDMSRLGYPEAWTTRGENVWKRRMALMATCSLNEQWHQHTDETFQVLRHQMETDEPILLDAIATVLASVKDKDRTERFLAWWAPRMERENLSRVVQNLDPDSSRQILALN